VGALLVFAAPVRAQAPDGDRVAIARLLERRAAAVEAGDLDAFMATIGSPDSEFGRAQRDWFLNLAEIPLSRYRLHADWSAYGDLARAADRRHYGAEVSIPLTVERSRIRGFDERDVRQDLYLTFVKRGGEWLIEGDDDLDPLGFMTQRNLWDFDPIDALESPRTLVVAPNGTEGLERVAATAGRALTAVDRYWSEGWSGKVPIFVPDDPAVLGRIIQATYPVSNYVAFSFWTGGEGEHPGARVIVNPDGFAGASDQRALSILTHELMHVATIPSSGPHIPRFIEEGLAQYVQYDGDRGLISSVTFDRDGELPDDNEYFVGDSSRVLNAYAKGLSAVGFFVERWGYDDLVRFYVRLGKRGSGPGTGRFHVDRVMRSVIGVGLGRFEELWAGSIGA
jgi:hypothetical protein